MLQTLGNALSCSRYHNLIHRYADLTEIAIRSKFGGQFRIRGRYYGTGLASFVTHLFDPLSMTLLELRLDT